jgi:amidohydrolase
MPINYTAQIIAEIDRLSNKLWEISTALFKEPETAFKEYKACKILMDELEAAGFTVERGIAGLETAFRAISGDAVKPKIAILAEYDALVGLGHACGHNLIAAAAIGAGIALSALTPKLPGQIQVIGTPAEEGGGGKIILAKAGVFDDIDAAMMFHPASKNMVLRRSLADTEAKIEFIGKASHAAAAPEEGVNALDAMILTFNNINAFRQTMGPKDRIAGIITHGGERSNIVPAYTAAEFSIRALSSTRRDLLVEKVIACAQAGAQAVGCELKYTITPGYREIIPNKVMANLFTSHLEQLGRVVVVPDLNERMGSTDMGDVSHLVPAIHPYLAIAPEKVAGHTVEFREYCNSETGRAAMLDAAKAMAMTAADLMTQKESIAEAKQELASSLKNA